ncbi:unnamed protein product, partial [Ixodes persulcatus]
KAHRGAARHQCRFCAYSSQIKHNVTMHERTHTGERPFVCEVCHKAFTQRIDLIYHMRTHTGEKPHKCSTCGKEFRKAGHLKGHLRVHTGERPYKCLTCGLEVVSHLEHESRFLYLWVVVFAVHDIKVLSGQSTSKDTSKKKPQRKSKHKCSFCPYTSPHKSHVVVHERTHTGDKPFRCLFCQKTFTQRVQLKYHETVHTGERPFRCLTCQASFNQRAHLEAHERTHTGERPFVCDTCGKAFPKKAHLKDHERLHTGEKPYKCSVCEMEFKSSPTPLQLEIHKKKKGGPCLARTVSTGGHDRARHSRARALHECRFCPYSCENKLDLVKHERTHTGEKPFQCQSCLRGFTTRANYVRHLKVHREGKFKCSFCDAVLTDKKYRTVHERVHCGNAPW